LEIADLEAIEAIAVYGFRTGFASVVRPDRGEGEKRSCRSSNSQPGANTKYVATGYDRTLGIVGDFVIYSSSRPGMNQDDAWR